MTTSMMSPSPTLANNVLCAGAKVLVATDGTAQSDGALRVALARAGEMRANIEVVTVATPEPVMAPEMPFALWSEANLLRRTAQREAVEEQLQRVTGRPHAHPVVVLDGNPSFTVARSAIEQHVSLIVVGLGRHNVTDRLFSDETALQLARISRVPVLAVPANAVAIPRHAVVAVDFSELALRAAQAAIEAVSDTGRVELVHVMPYVNEDPFTVEGKEPYQSWVEEQLAALTGKLVIPAGVTVTSVAIRGRPAPDLLAYAHKVDADLVVAGSHGRGFVARAFLGSVTTKLMRAATCSVLTVPRDPLPSLAAQREAANALPEGEDLWTERLDAFTHHNIGRRTILEVDDLEIGAQAQEYNYPLIAAMYDRRDRRVEIMLGDQSASGRHLSRSIGGVVGVDVLTDGHGHDVALRLAHGSSQTLLTFAP